jgi:hypothetical protein
MQEGLSISSFGLSIIYLWAYIHQHIKWHPKTKTKVLQVQFNSFATMPRKMQVSNDDQRGKTKWRLTFLKKHRLDLPISSN